MIAIKAKLSGLTRTKDAFVRHKICPHHGLQYLLIRDPMHPGQTGMCAHPACTHALLTSLEKIRLCGYLIRFARKLDKDRNQTGEFEMHVIEALLKEAKRGKPTILNPLFMKWTCLSYLQKLKFEEFKEAQHLEILRQIDGLLEEDAAEVLENMTTSACANSFMSYRSFSNPEKTLAAKEFVTLFIEEWGKELYLLYMGELSNIDFMRITKITPNGLRQLQPQVEAWTKMINKPNLPHDVRNFATVI
jgi:hypothetical protein